jgi:hypothetical protein
LCNWPHWCAHRRTTGSSRALLYQHARLGSVRSSASRASLHPHAVVLDNKRSPLIEHAPAGVRAIPKCGLARCQGGASQDGWVAARLAAHGDRDPRACDDRSHWLCHPRITPWTAADATNSLGPPVAVVVPEPPGRGAVPAPATHRAPCAFPRASPSSKRPDARRRSKEKWPKWPLRGLPGFTDAAAGGIKAAIAGTEGTMARKSKERQQPEKSKGEPCFSCRGDGRIWDHVCPSSKGTGCKPSSASPAAPLFR